MSAFYNLGTDDTMERKTDLVLALMEYSEETMNNKKKYIPLFFNYRQLESHILPLSIHMY